MRASKESTPSTRSTTRARSAPRRWCATNRNMRFMSSPGLRWGHDEPKMGRTAPVFKPSGRGTAGRRAELAAAATAKIALPTGRRYACLLTPTSGASSSRWLRCAFAWLGYADARRSCCCRCAGSSCSASPWDAWRARCCRAAAADRGASTSRPASRSFPPGAAKRMLVREHFGAIGRFDSSRWRWAGSATRRGP